CQLIWNTTAYSSIALHMGELSESEINSFGTPPSPVGPLTDPTGSVVNARHGHALGAVAARALPPWRHPLPPLRPRAYAARPLPGRQEGTALARSGQPLARHVLPQARWRAARS